MKNDGLCRVLLCSRIERKVGSGILYVKNITKMLQRKVCFCGIDDITFCPSRGIALSRAAYPSKTARYVQACYKK